VVGRPGGRRRRRAARRGRAADRQWLFEVKVLAPRGGGGWGDAGATTYALVAALAALVATGLRHLLTVSTPAAEQFFAWIMALITVVGGIVLPLTLTVDLGAKVATALINMAIGSAITG
jgi:uncharacterized protein DUF6069